VDHHRDRIVGNHLRLRGILRSYRPAQVMVPGASFPGAPARRYLRLAWLLHLNNIMINFQATIPGRLNQFKEGIENCHHTEKGVMGRRRSLNIPIILRCGNPRRAFKAPRCSTTSSSIAGCVPPHHSHR
jgi:hypothetical protein